MNILEDWRVKEALDQYVRACGGDPNLATADVVRAEQKLEEELGRKIGRKASNAQGTLGGVG